jgi:hypothetical protein
VMTRLSGYGTFRGLASDLRPQFNEVSENVGLATHSSAIIGGWLEMVEMTVARTPRRCTASISERKSPSPENKTMWSTCSASSIASTASSMSMLPLTLRRPSASMNSLAGLVTTVNPL